MGLQHLKEKTKTKMKTTTLKAVAAFGLSALLAGSAAAQESKSKPVGYETLAYTAGFNYLGLRLHEAPASSGASGAVTIGSPVIPVADGVADALTTDVTYLFEVTSGDAAGAVVLVDSFDAATDTVTLASDISDDFVEADTFIIRPSATLASVFGATNDVANSGAGLTSTASFGTCDQIWVPDGAGSFEKYAYVKGNPFAGTLDGWKNAAGAAITPADVDLIYVDGIIVNGAAAGNLVVSGSVKLEGVSIALTTTFNYVSGVFPAGLTLTESELSATLTSTASFGTSDQVWIPNGVGGFAKYAWVKGNPFAGTADGWRNAALAAVDGATVSFDGSSGVIIFRAGNAESMVTIDSPDFYDAL